MINVKMNSWIHVYGITKAHSPKYKAHNKRVLSSSSVQTSIEDQTTSKLIIGCGYFTCFKKHELPMKNYAFEQL